MALGSNLLFPIQFVAMAIVMVNSVSMGSSLAFSTTAAVVYSSKNTTNLNEVLDEEQTSWLGMLNFLITTYILIKVKYLRV